MLSLGTVRINRGPNSNTSMPKETQLITWYDNKLVNILSTYAGNMENASSKIRIVLPSTKAIPIYKDTGRVHLLDSVLGQIAEIFFSVTFFIILNLNE